MSVLLLSGGVDSTVLLAVLRRRGEYPYCVSFDYGQRHKRELAAALSISHYYRVPHAVYDLPNDVFRGSALTGGVVPVGHYTDLVQTSTVVPNRNMVFLSVAASVAKRFDRKTVYFAAHNGDATIYPDCRAGFVAALNDAMFLACGVKIEAPFLDRTKKEVVQLGRELGVPLNLTWTCYNGGESPCGECGACVERVEAES